MPITAELENVKKLESVGFNHNQAVILSEIHEATSQDSVKELKEFIRAENKELRSEIHSEIKELRSELNSLELRLNASISEVKGEMKASSSEVKGEIKASQSDLLVKIFGLIFGCSSLVVAILKMIL